MSAEQFANFPETTLTAAMADGTSTVTFSVASAATFPSVPQFRVQIDSELFLVNSISGGTSWTANRAIEGSGHSSHASGAAVTGVLTAGALGSTSDAAASTPSIRTLGTGSQQACAGNDSRLSNSRAPAGSAGGDLSGSYPNPTVANVNAVAFPASPGTNTVPVCTSANQVAWEAVPNAALQNSSLTLTAGTGLSGGGSVSLGSSTTLSLACPVVAAAYCTVSGTTVTVVKQFNFSTSVTRNSAGNYTLSFTTATSDANYVVVTNAESSGSIFGMVTPSGKSTASFTIRFVNVSGTGVDPAGFDVAVIIS